MSARTKLTLSYAGFLLAVAAALVVVFASVLRFVQVGRIYVDQGGAAGAVSPDREALVEVLVPRLAVALVVLLVVGSVAGWLLAGRMLAPLHRVHAVAQQVSAGALDARVHLQGPRDELRELADTFDVMLERLQVAFAEQQRFAANASHELRTPHAVMRSLLEVALSDPAAHRSDADEQLLRRLEATNRRSEQLIEALLTLSRLEVGQLATPQPVDLAEIVTAAVAEARPDAERRGLQVRARIEEGDFDGEETLVRQLVANLLANAVRHNTGRGGSVDVATGTREDGSVQLVVANTGPQLAVQDLPQLLEPFVRGAGRTAAPHGEQEVPGSGLGLAIVARIAAVHDAQLHLAPRPAGGLDVIVVFPAPRQPSAGL